MSAEILVHFGLPVTRTRPFHRCNSGKQLFGHATVATIINQSGARNRVLDVQVGEKHLWIREEVAEEDFAALLCAVEGAEWRRVGDWKAMRAGLLTWQRSSWMPSKVNWRRFRGHEDLR